MQENPAYRSGVDILGSSSGDVEWQSWSVGEHVDVGAGTTLGGTRGRCT